ncbi:MAG: ABC transporter substrate-binding protein [Natrinema limicola]
MSQEYSRDSLTVTRRRLLQGVTAAGIAGAAGCLGGNENDTTATYTAADSTDAESMNFIQVSDSNTNDRLGLTMDGAYAITPELNVFPLWLDIEDTGDATVFVATLRDNLEWGAGYGQMTADDWVYMIQEVHQGADNWALSTAAGNWDGIRVEATGSLEFQIELEEPNPDWPLEPTLWGAYCLPKGLLDPYVDERDGAGLDQDEDVQKLAYTGNLGPYTFERWERGSEFVVTRNDDYYMRDRDAEDFPSFVDDDQVDAWQQSPNFDEFSWRAIDEQSTRLTAFEQGEITETAVPSSRVERFEGDPDIDVKQIPFPYLRTLAYNQRMNGWEELRTKAVRQALSMAIDKTEIADSIHRGYARTAQTFQPEWSEWYDKSAVTEFGEGDSYDQAAARTLLADNLSAGYGYDDGTLLGPDGEQVTLTMAYARGSETVKTTAEFIGTELEAIGIDVEFDDVTFDRLIQQYVHNEWQGDDDPPWSNGPSNAGPRDTARSKTDWDLMYGNSFNTYPRTPAAIDAFWTERASANYFGYVPEADLSALFSTVRTSTDQQARTDAMAEIFGILSEDQPVNFVVMTDNIVGYQHDVEGPNAVFGQEWDRHTWRFTKA